MTTETSFKRTRLAPTPSGYLHLGNVLSFSLTAALARKTDAKIMLRIDDLDHERAEVGYVKDIFETLTFLEIPFDEGPRNTDEFISTWSQIQRLHLYRNALQQLHDYGLVYACTCSRSQVQLQTGSSIYPGTCRNKLISFDDPSACWRLKTEKAGLIQIKTLQGNETVPFPAEMHDFIVRKKDGMPAYQLSSVIDDVHFGVDLIVRGQDLWPSTLAQLYLAGLLKQNAFLNATFFHHTLLKAANGFKLSKSAGDTSVHSLRSQHQKKEDLFRMLGNSITPDQNLTR